MEAGDRPRKLRIEAVGFREDTEISPQPLMGVSNERGTKRCDPRLPDPGQNRRDFFPCELGIRETHTRESIHLDIDQAGGHEGFRVHRGPEHFDRLDQAALDPDSRPAPRWNVRFDFHRPP